MVEEEVEDMAVEMATTMVMEAMVSVLMDSINTRLGVFNSICGKD